MSIVVFSINHNKADIEFREKVSFKSKVLHHALELIKESDICKEGVILATCNRSELIARFTDLEQAEEWCGNFFQDVFKVSASEMEGKYDYKVNYQAVTYLYRVCCGLDSIVLGEDQILGQVKRAHEIAMEKGASKKILNRLFFEAVTAAKKIRSGTKISENPLSISYIAVKQAQKKLGDLSGKKVLVIGYGKMSKLAVSYLLDLGVERVFICNRSTEKVNTIKNERVKSVTYDQKYEFLKEADVIISATGAPHHIFHYEEFRKKYHKVNKKIVMVDIAIPRDMEPSIGDIEGVSLYHIDDLKEIAKENIRHRKKLVDGIELQIQQYVMDFIKWQQCVPIHPKIKEIQQNNQIIMDQELEQLFKKLNNLSQKDCKIIEQSVRGLVKRMWNKPILQMKQASEEGYSEEAIIFAQRYLGCGE